MISSKQAKKQNKSNLLLKKKSKLLKIEQTDMETLG